MSSYRDLLRQKYELGHQMSGSALMGGVMGGYEGAGRLPAFGEAARKEQTAQWKLAHPEYKYNGPVKGSAEAKEAGRKMHAAKARNYAKLAEWYKNQTAANNGKPPTAQQIRIARAELALARAKEKPNYESKAGQTRDALAKMTPQQREAYDRAAAAKNAAARDMNRLINATKGIVLALGPAPPIHYEESPESSPIVRPRSLKARLKAESKVEKREESPTVIYTKKTSGKKKKP